MGVHNQLPALHAQKAEGKAHQFGAVEPAHPNASRLPGGNGESQRSGVTIRESPDLPFDLFGLLQVFETLQVANGDTPFWICSQP